VALRLPTLDGLPAPASVGRAAGGWRHALLAVAWTLLVVAAARPQSAPDPALRAVTGRELLLALDTSGSMGTGDMVIGRGALTRLAAVQRVAGDFVGRRAGDRIGLLVFGDRAQNALPMTYDRAAVRELLGALEVGMLGNQTALGDALALAVQTLKAQPQPRRVLVLLTDGANTGGATRPEVAAWLAAREGVRVYAIGLGRPRADGAPADPARDLDEAWLTQLATQTGGRYFRADATDALEAVYRELDALEPALQSDAATLAPREWWPALAGGALALLLVAAWPALQREPGEVRA
jgi:Ca-activated chloride channel family protein